MHRRDIDSFVLRRAASSSSATADALATLLHEIRSALYAASVGRLLIDGSRIGAGDETPVFTAPSRRVRISLTALRALAAASAPAAHPVLDELRRWAAAVDAGAAELEFATGNRWIGSRTLLGQRRIAALVAALADGLTPLPPGAETAHSPNRSIAA